MCERPVERDGNTFGCRSCNACIGKRKRNWMARAMAERAEWPYTLCIALTYDPKQSRENRDAREFFVYDDVRAFVHRLTSASRYYAKKHKLNIKPRVKFLAAGEQGSKGDMHCHWHMIIYSDLDLMKLGEFKGMKGGKKVVLTEPRDLITVGESKKRLDWTLWGKGFVTLQKPDQGGVAYVLAYSLKDQFTEEKSRGTMREHKVENFATGLFRMSKLPPIGETWLVKKMERLDAIGAVLPSLRLMVPDLTGYWEPSGSFREKLLWFLVALNKRALWSTGANAPQWTSLLQSCKDLPSDLEILLGPQQEDPDDYEDPVFAAQKRARDYYAGRKGGETRSPGCCCQSCLDSADDKGLAQRGLYRLVAGRDRAQAYYWDGQGPGTGDPVQVWTACNLPPDQRGLSASHKRAVRAIETAGGYEAFAAGFDDEAFWRRFHEKAGEASPRHFCKPRPEKTSGDGGSRPFVPWCKK